MPVIYDDDLNFVNAIPRRGVVEGTIQDSTYSRHLVAVFRLKPNKGSRSQRNCTDSAAAMKDGLYRVDWKGICAGFVVERGLVTRCAPILRRKIDFFKTIAVWIMP